MLPRPLRLLLDSGEASPEGVVLSGFRSRDPERSRSLGKGGEEEEEEEEEAPVSVWDEDEDGATFTVTSRQYRPLDPLVPLPPPRSSRRLRAGTLSALVRHLLDARTSGSDLTFMPAFLATHRAFTSTPTVLGLLADRLEALESSASVDLCRTRGLAISVLSTWLTSHPEDFGSEVRGQLDRLESFLLRTGDEAGEVVGGDIVDLIQDLRSRVALPVPDLPKPLVSPGDPPADPTDVLVFLADHLAEQLTLLDAECRLLRNFSSVYAVVSALQSSPIHRLRLAWGEITRDSLRLFSSLCQIFSEEDNYSQSRELLLQEAKVLMPLESNIKKPVRNVLPQGGGVVPYLGTFLKDLVMLDAASRDELENGYINFDKRRKEFSVLCELRRLQDECRRYDLQPDPNVQHWLQGLQPLTEAQSHHVSCEVEPSGVSDPPAPRMLRPTLVISHWTDVLGSVGGPTPLVSWDQPGPREDSTTDSPAPLLTRLAQHMKWPSVSSLDSALDGAPSSHTPANPSFLSPTSRSPRPTRGHRRSASCGSPFSSGSEEGTAIGTGSGSGKGSGPGASDCRIIRVQMELGNDGSVYKSILVTSQDKAPSVISCVLKKNNRDPAIAADFELVQLLPSDRELTIPPSANVFYAMDGASSDFLLRHRRQPSSVIPGFSSRSATSADSSSEGGGGSFPRIKATGRKIARALF
ncbi:ral guanine nucleotide dissociation stimulator-like 2 isoform X3 [Sarcophilus harrisii]|uniref:ral guanine nucleotide dissociation stimulator-like 2 isoform X3 n=1 Tax=Sarcophilus harrisii TaxID=9305 RepID=UPI000C7BEFC3|nr:ral guanine nucleotide dissociation stimulator-like 2 isoform X3 [Sarcophilus harrisii]